MSEKTTYIPGLDGIRAIAFGLVFAAHSGLEKLVPGGLGVTIFFFLSGYLITTLLRMESEKSGTISIPQFYLRRTFRIFPPMYVTLGIAVLLVAAGIFVGPQHWQGNVVALFYLTNYSGYFTPYAVQKGLGILWSLSVEEHFYLLFPWIFLLFVRRGWSREQRSYALAGLCFLALLWRYVLFTHFHATHNYSHTDTRYDSILWGALLAVAMNPFLDKVPEWIGKRAGMLARGGVGLLLAALIIRGELFREAFRYSLQGLALAMIFTFILYAPGSRVVRWLEHPLMRLLGRRSYAMYLIHYCVLLAMEEKLRLPRLGTAVVAAIITFGYATAMWHLVESPMAKLKKSLSGSKRAKIAHPVMELGSGAPAVSDRI